MDVIWEDSGTKYHHLTQETSRHVKLDTAQLTALGLPDDGNPKFATLVYLTSPITLSAGNIDLGTAIEIKGPGGDSAPVDAVKGLKVDTSKTVNRTFTYGVSSGFVAMSSAGFLGTLTGSISGGGVIIQLFDNPTIPNDNAVPMFVFQVDDNGTFSFDYGIYGLPMLSGLSIVASTTYGILTRMISPSFNVLVTFW